MTDSIPILEADSLYHVYESKAEEGNVVALRGLSVRVGVGEAVGDIRPPRDLRSVDFPEPEGPITATASPTPTRTESPLRATTLPSSAFDS